MVKLFENNSAHKYPLYLQRLLTATLNKLFTKKSFEGDFALVSNVDGMKGKNICMPDGIRYVAGCVYMYSLWLMYGNQNVTMCGLRLCAWGLFH